MDLKIEGWKKLALIGILIVVIIASFLMGLKSLNTISSLELQNSGYKNDLNYLNFQNHLLSKELCDNLFGLPDVNYEFKQDSNGFKLWCYFGKAYGWYPLG